MENVEDLCEYEEEFIRLLKADVERINSYFMEQEENCVIKLQTLQEHFDCIGKNPVPDSRDKHGGVRGGEEEKLRLAFVDLHGELVLLLHWSIVNYAGILKILKKHDKLLGGHTQKKLLGSILQQPFTSTESINRLVNTAETCVKQLSTQAKSESVGVDQILEDEDKYKLHEKVLRSSQMALHGDKDGGLLKCVVFMVWVAWGWR